MQDKNGASIKKAKDIANIILNVLSCIGSEKQVFYTIFENNYLHF